MLCCKSRSHDMLLATDISCKLSEIGKFQQTPRSCLCCPEFPAVVWTIALTMAGASHLNGQKHQHVKFSANVQALKI